MGLLLAIWGDNIITGRQNILGSRRVIYFLVGRCCWCCIGRMATSFSSHLTFIPPRQAWRISDQLLCLDFVGRITNLCCTHLPHKSTTTAMGSDFFWPAIWMLSFYLTAMVVQWQLFTNTEGEYGTQSNPTFKTLAQVNPYDTKRTTPPAHIIDFEQSMPMVCNGDDI